MIYAVDYTLIISKDLIFVFIQNLFSSISDGPIFIATFEYKQLLNPRAQVDEN